MGFLLACSVCFGNPADPSTKALIASMLALLGCVGFVLAAIVWTSIVWAQRARRLNAPLPGRRAGTG